MPDSINPSTGRPEFYSAIDAGADVEARMVALIQAAIKKDGSATSTGFNTPGASNQLAAADHVHDFGKSIQRVRVAATSQDTSWVFPVEFKDKQGNPVKPIIGCMIEAPMGSAIFSEPQITVLSSTGCTISIRAQATALSISLGALTLFGGGIPANTFLHLSARNPGV